MAKGATKVVTNTTDTTTATNAAVTVGSSSTTVLAANTGRKGFSLVNDSDETIYVSFSGTAVSGEGIRLNEKGGSVTDDVYQGVITAICASGGKNLTVIEL